MTGTVTAGMLAHDTAHVTGAAAVTPTGTVTYTFFTNDTCTGTGRAAGTVTLGATGAVPNSTTQGPLTAGAYSFGSSYPVANYHGSIGACEPFTVAASPPAAPVAPSPPPAPVAPITNVTVRVTG